MTTKTSTDNIGLVTLDAALHGDTLSPWMKVETNRWGGVDVTNTRSGGRFRIYLDDTDLVIHVDTRGVVAGGMRLTGMFASAYYAAGMLRDWL